MTTVIRIEGINPTPWMAPEVSVGRVGGRYVPKVFKKSELRAYQEAIKEELENYDGPTYMTGSLQVTFYFWRRIEKYTNAGGKLVRKHRADATNLQKSTEDALQGIVFKNDNQVQTVTSVVVEEGDEVEPFIIVVVCPEDSDETFGASAEAHRTRAENLRNER